jgi:hypothetical protein
MLKAGVWQLPAMHRLLSAGAIVPHVVDARLCISPHDWPGRFP